MAAGSFGVSNRGVIDSDSSLSLLSPPESPPMPVTPAALAAHGDAEWCPQESWSESEAEARQRAEGPEGNRVHGVD